MFRRRRKMRRAELVREFCWPRAGWWRWSKYLYHRVRRMPGSPESIAAGVACGAAMSFTPFVGLHFVLAALLAWLIRANIFASAIGTAVGNPWTFPFIWLWIYELGRRLMGDSESDVLPGELSLRYIFDNPLDVLLPMLLGGLITAAVAWVVFYWSVKRMLQSYHRHRRARRKGARASRRKQVREETGR